MNLALSVGTFWFPIYVVPHLSFALRIQTSHKHLFGPHADGGFLIGRSLACDASLPWAREVVVHHFDPTREVSLTNKDDSFRALLW